MLRLGGLRGASTAAITRQYAPLSPSFPPKTTRNRLAIAAHIMPLSGSTRTTFTIQRTSIATKSPSGSQRNIDYKGETNSPRKVTPNPGSVTTASSVRHLSESSVPQKEPATSNSVQAELKTIQELLSLSSVPKEPYWLGLAGTLPYFGTSVSTVYLAWILNTTWPSSSAFANNFMINQEAASRLLAMLEPIQLGYGAIIISFLGAIHWGLEYAEKVPDEARTRFRYGIGVVASIVAWPTLFIPVEFALTSQFLAFVALYFADARATTRGWAPAWYAIYRFALTAVVGVAIAISLIGRAKVGDASPRLTGLSDKFHQDRGEEYTKKWQDLEEKERIKVKQQEKEEADRKAAKAQEQETKATERKSDADKDHAEKQ
ncbi:hypothetical protein GGR50DRAFT_691638 [Xylaria sp. CBS 124048]|nr:hypothetical protein GGR50DRAFT_691638 [Xylaria sp. CBS 124048]